MISFRITINDSDPIIIGQEDSAVLIASITATQFNGISGSFGGLSEDKEHGFGEHFRWELPEISLNDKVLIEPIESDSIIPPAKRFRSDREVKESPFTEEEEKELRYQSYLEYKKEFEPE